MWRTPARGLAHPFAHVVFGLYLSVGHTLRTRRAWTLAFGWALPSAHLKLGLSAWELATPPACMWCLGTLRPNYFWAPYAAEPKIALDH